MQGTREAPRRYVGSEVRWLAAAARLLATLWKSCRQGYREEYETQIFRVVTRIDPARPTCGESVTAGPRELRRAAKSTGSPGFRDSCPGHGLIMPAWPELVVPA